MPQIGDVLGGTLLLEQELGAGGMGVVFRAVDQARNSACAVKVCLATDEDSRRRFAREARLMQNIRHDNVISIIDVNLESDPPYIVMPLARHSLASEIGASMDEDQAIDAMLQICAGVQAIHSAQGTHRDIKPDNVLRLEDGRLVVSDLGLIKIDPRDTTVLTQTSMVLGTRVYCAPEQLMPGGSREADARTDVYLLGKTFYHLLSGELPALVDPSRIPTGLAIIIQRATREHPSERFQSVGHLVDAINAHVLAKQPGANASRVFDGQLAEAVAAAKVGEYREENISRLLDALLMFAIDAEVFVDQFGRVPIEIIQVAASRHADKMLVVLEKYVDALEVCVGRKPYEYAEFVASQMQVVRNGAVDPRLRSVAIAAVLVAAVRLNRFAAMSVFDSMLLSVDNEAEAVALDDVLRRHIHAYSGLADRIPRVKLHAALHAIREQAEDYGKSL